MDGARPADGRMTPTPARIQPVALGLALLMAVNVGFTYSVYADGAGRHTAVADARALAGQRVWQQNNCQACHQIYGLGGYMGPDLTNILSDPARGEDLARAIIRGGTRRMPDFRLPAEDIDALIAYLKSVDRSGRSRIPLENIDRLGNYTLE